MNKWKYAKIIGRFFPGSIRHVMGREAKPILVQEHEKTLWTDEAREAMRQHGVEKNPESAKRVKK